MKIDETSLIPIFMQVAEWLEEEILRGNIKEEEQIPSTNQFATTYSINPATARKGFTLLVEEGILYKKRGIGMFVAEGAREKIQEKAKERFIKETLQQVWQEAKKLGMSKDDIVELLKQFE